MGLREGPRVPGGARPRCWDRAFGTTVATFPWKVRNGLSNLDGWAQDFPAEQGEARLAVREVTRGGMRAVKGTRTRCVQNKTAWPSPCPPAGKGPQSKRRLPGSISTTINTRSRLSKRSSKCQTSAKGQVAETSEGRTEAGAGGVSRVCSHVPRATRCCHGRSGDSDGDPATRWLQESEGDPHEGGREGAPRPGSKRTRAEWTRAGPRPRLLSSWAGRSLQWGPNELTACWGASALGCRASPQSRDSPQRRKGRENGTRLPGGRPWNGPNGGTTRRGQPFPTTLAKKRKIPSNG